MLIQQSLLLLVLLRFQALNWMQTRLHGTRKQDHTAVSSRCAHTSGDLHRNDDELDGGWEAAMLSIGTFGGPKGRHGSDTPWTTAAAGADELDRLQEELRLLVRAQAVVTGAEDDGGGGGSHRRSLSRTSSSTNGREVVAKLKQRSIRKIMAAALGGLLHRPSCRETMPEATIIWSLLHKNTHPEKPALPEPVMNGDPTVQTPQKDKQEGTKWIRTDSEYIVLDLEI
uniref:Secreted protein n=1 Tax=Oryza meridionalis TaxID=40149 RepID=A0A0E0CW73_9ORYZ